MNSRQREDATLSFGRLPDGGAVEECVFPWDLTIDRWRQEGLPSDIADIVSSALFPAYHGCRFDGSAIKPEESYMDCLMTEGVYKFEQFFGLDAVKRVFFNFPYGCVEGKIPIVSNEEDWKQAKERYKSEIEKYYTDENIHRTYGKLKEGQEKGEFPIRLAVLGFFWAPRNFFGIEGHLLAFYDYPEMMHDMNEFLLQFYLEKLGKVLDILPADVIYISEDLSGKNGPMLSPLLFDEFVGSYYKRLVPCLKQKGVKHIFVDTDGDFEKLIPNFIEAGIEGFLPMDVNAGMDIVAIRQKYPAIKFIGSFNKLAIAEGKEAIDREFERLKPVIRQGGFIPGCDHQVAPATPYKNYLYYVNKLKEAMKEAGKDLCNI